MGRGLDGSFWMPVVVGVLCSSQGPPGVPPSAGVPRHFPVALAWGKHLFPFRTEQLSPTAPMVLGLQGPGRVGRRRFLQHHEPPERAARGRWGRGTHRAARRSPRRPRGAGVRARGRPAGGNERCPVASLATKVLSSASVCVALDSSFRGDHTVATATERGRPVKRSPDSPLKEHPHARVPVAPVGPVAGRGGARRPPPPSPLAHPAPPRPRPSRPKGGRPGCEEVGARRGRRRFPSSQTGAQLATSGVSGLRPSAGRRWA